MAEQKPRFSPALLAGDGMLLLCALVGLTGCFFSLYTGPETWGWADISVLEWCADEETLFLRCAVAFALLSLAVWSLPRFRGAAAGGLAAVWGLAVWRWWDEVMSGAAFICKAVADLFAARVDWGKTFPYESSMGLIRAAANARVFLLLALAALALALGWAVVRARRWWLALALTLPPLLPGLLADFYPAWPPFLALSACWCAMMLTDLCRWAAPSGRGKLTLAALPAVAAALLLVSVMFPREGYTRPPWALEAEIGLHSAANRLSDFFSQWEGPFGFGSTITYVGSAGEEDLASAGPLRYSGRTVLRVSSDYSRWMYLRGSSLAAYENGVWKALPEGAYEQYSPADSPRVCPLYFPAMLGADDSTVYTVTVDNVGAVGSCVYAPYFPLPQDVDETGMMPVEDALLARKRGQWSHTVTFVERKLGDYGTGVRVVAGVGRPGDAALGQYLGQYDDFVYEHYLDVPEELRDGLEEVCWRVNALGTPPESGEIQAVWQAGRVAAYLDALCEYDPETPAAPEGTDPVLYFLNESRRGYCMHYASAAALLLRTMGIPARYVSGFTADCAAGQRVDVPDRAAHAWVEVWVSGFGWYPVEVTPAAAFDWYGTGAVPGEAPSSAPPEERGTPEPTPTPAQEPDEPSGPPSRAPGGEDAPGGGGFARTLPGWAKWLALIPAGAALAWLGQFLVKKRRAAGMSGPDPNRAALACYGYLLGMERWGGRVSPRAVELAEKAKFSQHTLSQEELDELRVLMDWERGRLGAILPPVKRLLFRYWWGAPENRGKKPQKP